MPSPVPPPASAGAALKLISFGIVQVEPLISHRFTLEGTKDAFELAAARGGLKAMVAPHG